MTRSGFWLILLPLVPLAGAEPDLIVADFDGDTFGAWEAEGEAFAFGPARIEPTNANGVDGVKGTGYLASHVGGYQLEGALTSPEFLIQRPFVNFLLGGGNVGPVYLALMIDGTEIRTALPNDTTRVHWTTWDVSDLVGREARIRVVDDRSGHVDGFILVDSIVQSDKAMAPPSTTRMRFEDVLNTRGENPDPEHLPTLSVWRQYDETYLSIRFPELPDSPFDAWCYETDGAACAGAEVSSGGSVILRHQLDRDGHRFTWVTEVVPGPGKVIFRIRPAANDALGESLPEVLPTPNLCFQLRRAIPFKSDRSGLDGKGYPGFIERCFIYTEQGRVFLNQTDRRKIPARPATDPENNPPWVQNYVGIWRERPEARPGSWADTSSDRFVVPIIGAVSTDGSMQVALADDSADQMCQAWHDCIHTYPKWQPTGAPASEQTWTMGIYLTPDNSEELLRRVGEDFPAFDMRAKNSPSSPDPVVQFITPGSPR